MQQRLVFRQGRFQGLNYSYMGAKGPHAVVGQGSIITAGSITTITSAPGTLNAPGTNWANPGGTIQAFSAAAVGDLIQVTLAGVETVRFIQTKNTHDSVVVDAAINIPVASIWYHRPQRAGITDSDGWINVQGLQDKLLFIELTTKGSGTGITYSLETRGSGVNAVPRQLMSGTLTAAVVAGTTNPLAADTVVIPEAVQDIRVGVKNDNGGVDICNAWVTGVLA